MQTFTLSQAVCGQPRRNGTLCGLTLTIQPVVTRNIKQFLFGLLVSLAYRVNAVCFKRIWIAGDSYCSVEIQVGKCRRSAGLAFSVWEVRDPRRRPETTTVKQWPLGWVGGESGKSRQTLSQSGNGTEPVVCLLCSR